MHGESEKNKQEFAHLSASYLYKLLAIAASFLIVNFIFI